MDEMTAEQRQQATAAIALLADALGIDASLMAVACRQDSDGDFELRILIHPAEPTADDIIRQAERIIGQ